MTHEEQFTRLVIAAKLGARVADAVLEAIEALDLQLSPIPGGEAVAATPSQTINRVRVAGSTVQICTVQIGTAGWFVWREIYGAKLERSSPVFMPDTSGGLSIAAIAGLTGTGSSIFTSATQDKGLADGEAETGIAMIAAAGFGVEPVGGGTHAAVVPVAESERRICPGTGDRVSVVSVTLGTAGWALWAEIAVDGQEPERSAMTIVRRREGTTGSVFEAPAL